MEYENIVTVSLYRKKKVVFRETFFLNMEIGSHNLVSKRCGFGSTC